MSEMYTEEEVALKQESIAEEIIDDGWDSYVFYNYLVSATSPEKTYSDLLNQSTSVPMKSGFYPSDRAIVGHGVGRSFGGLLKITNPYTTRICSYQLYDPNNKNLKSMSEELVSIMFHEGMDAAERRAHDMVSGLPSYLIPQIYRGFIRVLIPVRYRELG